MSVAIIIEDRSSLSLNNTKGTKPVPEITLPASNAFVSISELKTLLFSTKAN
ncbi:MAG: hypothetical protein WCT85_02045 [Parachlamydiales bacterium]